MMEDLENKLVAVFNQSTLPFEAKRYVALAFFNTVENTYRKEKLKLKQTQLQKEGEVQDE